MQLQIVDRRNPTPKTIRWRAEPVDITNGLVQPFLFGATTSIHDGGELTIPRSHSVGAWGRAYALVDPAMQGGQR